MNVPFVVEPALPTETVAAFRLVFQHLPEREREARVAQAQVLLHRGELDPAGLLVARSPQGLLGALVCTPAPGAGGLVWPPQIVADVAAAPVEDELVRRGCSWLRQCGVKLVQALLPPTEAHLAIPLLRNGFEHVTALWYLRHSLELSAVLLSGPERLDYQTYLQAPKLFQQTLARTYEGTLDCPEVGGVRDMDEIIAGHRAQGDHDPERWWLALHAGRPAGVLLLTRMTDWDGWEVSYVGIVPEARRQGFGGELMRKAMLETRLAGAPQLALSVDARNRPAWDLYRRLGFETFDQREVYLALWKS